MDAVPNTINYMAGGYIVFTVVMVVYISSLVSRWKSLKRDQQMLEEIENQK